MSRCICVLILAYALIFLGGANVTASDAGQFRVNSYIPERFTDLEWRMNGGFGLSGSRRDSDGRQSPSRYDRYVTSNDSDTRDLHFSSQATYEYVTIPRWLNARLRIGGSGSAFSSEYFSDRHDTLSGSGYNVGDNKGSRYGFGVSQSVKAGQYLKADLFVSGALSYSYDYSGHPEDRYHSLDTSVHVDPSAWVYTSINETDAKTDSHTEYHRLRAEITPGWGRIYEGRFAATALNIVGELRKSDLIEREPGYEELLALTEIVYQYRLKHAVDSRLLRIEALDSVISYLHERGIIADPGPYGHLLIQDVWDYFANRQTRPFGWTVSAGVSLDYRKRHAHGSTDRTRYQLDTRRHPDSAGAIDTLSYYDTTERPSSNREDITNSPALIVRATYARPLNLRWQLGISAGGQFFFDAYESQSSGAITRRTDYRDFYDLYFSARADYHYDMRTMMSVSAAYDHPNRTQIVRAIGDDPLPDFEPLREESSWSLRLRANVTYRISIPTTLRCGLSWNKYHVDWAADDPYRNDNSSYQLSASISHWLY